MFNSKKICTIFDLDTLLSANLDYLRLDLRFFSCRDSKKIIETYTKAINILALKGKNKYDDFCKYFADHKQFKDYTRGHLKRGVK